MSRRYILTGREILTPEAVRAILAKEILLKAGNPTPTTGMLITARDPTCYFVWECRASDSARQYVGQDSARLTMLASEAVLRREWDTPEEDEAWANLLREKS